MTLRKYDEIMDQVEVTDEMKKRILSNIEKEDRTSTAPKRVFRWNKMASVAAGFIVLLVAGTLLYPQLIHKDEVEPDENVQQGVWGMQAYDSAKEMAEQLSFTMEDIPSLAEKSQETSYVVYDENLGEINYSWDDQSICYRKSTGREDNSGDWNEYSKLETVNVEDLTCTLKGNGDDSYVLATWTDGTYAYSLSATKGMSQNDLLDLIVEIKKNI